LLGSNLSAFRPAVVLPAALLLLVAAVAMGWYALNIHSDGIETKAADRSPIEASISVLFTKSDIVRGQIVRREDLESRNLSPKSVPKGALQNVSDVEGHVAKAAINADAPILNSEISSEALKGISAHVPIGYRAYALPVSEAEMAGGFLQIGDHVDLYVTLPSALFARRDTAGRRLDDQSKSTMLLQEIEVLAVGTKLETDGKADTTARTVTLSLPASALAKIALANRVGKISFAIRNPSDTAPAPSKLADLNLLIDDRRESAPSPSRRAAPATNRGVVIYAGAERSVVPVP